MEFFSKKADARSNESNEVALCERLKTELLQAESVIIGAGAGLSTSAGFVYTGSRFERYFHDFAKKYGFHDMYSGGFYPYKTLREHWAYWSRYIMINRYQDAPKPVYETLFSLVRNKDYFVITTNVDHCFQKAGFDKKRLYYTQGDYGLFQCSRPEQGSPCQTKTYDNEENIRAMCKAQHFSPESELRDTLMEIPEDLVPYCPVCGKPMSMNLRADDTFVQDSGWYEAAKRYEDFLNAHRAATSGKVLFLELGVGGNTPGIIKYPFWQMTAQNPHALYVCLNFGEAVCPKEIAPRSICINADIGEVLCAILESESVDS